ncbi:hypothetical protein SMACR_03487 [Sordaria macrospora]|uniref:WGS project CABT00000000 data, contig 2.9 n=2 Tax=Sordaria macrospora TaxID=5147 RepID=F7VVB6_SORMK|nr:uncharacterized protein SMAC_03487 [Sordaria macrospora k-hell]KAA8629217.1 hypothetical protein SMACR_03487 [Sordaria macrospora]WPJ65884.1 hypothetical protein SMAC4_03487 [Sordaria macrospora]CCC09457.1 unnamed protein product [Sordaria macrospora k-hell]
MSSPNLPSGARSFIFTTTRGKRCTAILKVVQSSNVRTTTGRNPRLPVTTTTSTTAIEATTTTIEETSREENPVPINTSASPPPPLEDDLLPGLTSTTSTPATTSSIAITSTSSPLLLTSRPVTEESPASQETETSLGASIVKVTASEISPDDVVTTPLASTVANLQPSSDNNAAQTTETPSIIPTISSILSTNNNSEAAKVAGGVLSGLVVLSLVGLFFWLWRRRRLQKRRRTLLTPLGTGPGTNPDRNEKMPYIISRRSIGPTAMFAKAKTALGHNVKRIRERISQTFSEGSIRILSPSNRPQSQGLLSRHGRNPSLVPTNEVKGKGSVKASILSWWSRITSHMYTSKRHNDEVVRDRYPGTGNTSERKARLQYQPDFLTLIRMDNDDLGHEAQGQQRRDSDKVPKAQPLHLGNERDTPFRDPNTLRRKSAIPAPLAAGTGYSDGNNPFSDRVPRPPPTTTTYNRIEDRRHRRRRQSRGLSISTNANTTSMTANPSRQPSTHTTYRESIDSSFTTHRNKFRSDSFDLERPELLGHGVPQVIMGSQGTATTGGPRHPPSAHTRQESLGGGGGSSRYSSYLSGGVVSLDDDDDEWRDPGPDVGVGLTSSAAGNGGYGRVRGGSVSVSVSVGRGGGRKMSVGRAM